jgi:hypothetical protein
MRIDGLTGEHRQLPTWFKSPFLASSSNPDGGRLRRQAETAVVNVRQHPFRSIVVGVINGLIVALIVWGVQTYRNPAIAITTPDEGDLVACSPERNTVSGTCGNLGEGQDIRVLVCPDATDKCWVQRAPILEGGEWHTSVQCGANGECDGEEYQVCAIVTTENLREGDEISVEDFPDCEAKCTVSVSASPNSTPVPPPTVTETPTQVPSPTLTETPTQVPSPTIAISSPREGEEVLWSAEGCSVSGTC